MIASSLAVRGIACAGLGAFAFLMLLQPLPRAWGEPVAWGVQSVTVLLACWAMLRRASRGGAQLRTARRLVAAALLVGASAGVLAVAWTLVAGQPPPTASPVDAVHLLFLPLVVAGLLHYPVVDTAAGSRLRALLDGVLAAGALWFVACIVLLGPARLGADQPLLVQLTVLAHPAADLFVLGMLASVLSRVAPEARRELVLTGSGLALYALADVGYCVLAAAGTYRADSWVSLGYQCGLILILCGALSREGTSQQVHRGGRLLAALPQVPVVAALVLAVVVAARGGALSGAGLAAALVPVSALFLRHLVNARDHAALTGRLQRREELFRSLVTGASDMITLHAADGRVIYASPAVERVVGRSQDELVGISLGVFVEPGDRVRLRRAFREVVASPDARVECRVRLRSAGGEWRWMQVLLQNRLHDPSVLGIIGNTRDVHERHVLERRLGHAAYHDALTGLGNLARARQHLERCYAGGRQGSAVLVDLDGFKAVNDTFGHAYGDALLEAVATRLVDCLRAGDEVARLGGDEFVVVVDADQDVAALCSRVLDALRAPIDVRGSELRIGASIGVALTADADGPEELLRNADLAMYASKAAGRDRVTWYEPQMHTSAARRMSLHRGLRTALEEGQLSLLYQPLVRLPDGALVGAEALLRWEHPIEGPIPPDVFIPVAEDSGIIGELDLWVLETACRDIASWRAQGLDVPRVSINVSRRHLSLELPRLVEQALARHGLPGGALCLEVTESAVLLDAEAATAALAKVRELGVAVALDDFGTGQSSLSQLARLPVDSVKIDRSFTQSAVSDPAALRLLTSIVGVCQALALPVVAEGVEEGEIARFLAEIGCDRAQGHHFALPLPAMSFGALLPAPSLPAPSLPAPRRGTEPSLTLPR